LEEGTGCTTTSSSSAHPRTLLACMLTAAVLTTVKPFALLRAAQKLGYVLLPSLF